MTTESYILYIEDERPVLDLIVQALKLAGYNATGVTSGEEGLTLMREHKPDLVLLDLMMPEISGWEVYRVMKTNENLANIPVIVITARVPGRNRVIVEGLPAVEDYITKPFDMKRLLRSIQDLLPTSEG
jgi:DNA-binding response OmpR family regulator